MAIQSLIKDKDSITLFVTDVEGDIEFFLKQIENSGFIELIEGKLEFKSQQGMFCFGGDLFDRGSKSVGGDLRLGKLLSTFKERYPDRVFLIAGNRDLNKTRFLTELPLDPHHHFDSLNIPRTPFAWPKDDLRAYLTSLVHGVDVTEETLQVLNTPVNRLRWILTKTMGAPTAFECRRKELAVIMGCTPENIGDEDVYLSFRLSVEDEKVVDDFLKIYKPSPVIERLCMDYGSWLRHYLEKTQLTLIINDVLFVHGGVNSYNIKRVPLDFSGFEPNTELEFKIYDDVLTWVEALNAWYTKALDRWLKTPFPEDSTHYQFSNEVPAAPLQHMASKPGSKYAQYTMIVANFFNEECKPKMPGPIAPDLNDHLHKNGIYYVFSGHQPHGNTPVYIAANNPKKAVTIITGDTLYGNKEAYEPVETSEAVRNYDPRGEALGTIIHYYSQENQSSHVEVKGRDGYSKEYEFKTPLCLKGILVEAQDPFLGKTLTLEGISYLVRINSRAENYVLSTIKGTFAIEYSEKTPIQLKEALEASGAFNSSRFFQPASLVNPREVENQYGVILT